MRERIEVWTAWFQFDREADGDRLHVKCLPATETDKQIVLDDYAPLYSSLRGKRFDRKDQLHRTREAALEALHKGLIASRDRHRVAAEVAENQQRVVLEERLIPGSVVKEDG